MLFNRNLVKKDLRELALAGIFIGTSSWKYLGWRDMLYDEARYVWRGRFAESRFERNCLSEYAEVFKTVCVDAAYYKFPEKTALEKLAAQVPSDFQFGFKVTGDITMKSFKNLQRFGARAGTPNDNFLNAALFLDAFLTPCEAIRNQVGLLVFEFTRFSQLDYAHGGDFIADLDTFLSRLPSGWPYGVELRNRTWLKEDYFACLAKHKVTHVFNSWEAMPPIGEQIALSSSRTNPDLVAGRLLLKPGRRYEDAVKLFQPYQKIGEIYEEGRTAAATLVEEGKKQPKRKTFLFVNNRLEGSALETIAGILETLRSRIKTVS